MLVHALTVFEKKYFVYEVILAPESCLVEYQKYHCVVTMCPVLRLAYLFKHLFFALAIDL